MLRYMPLFRACTTSAQLLQLHAHLLPHGCLAQPQPTTKLMEAYANLGNLENTKKVFTSFPSTPDSFMWGVLLKCLSHDLHFHDTISFFHQMMYCQDHPVCLNCFIFPPVVKACSGLCDVGTGGKVHGVVIKSGFNSDEMIDTALLEMYGGCGRLVDAQKVLDNMTMRDVVCWSAIMYSYFQSGDVYCSLEMFRRMVSENVAPDSATMSSLAQVYGYLGAVSEAKMVHGHVLRREMDLDGSLVNSLVVMYGKCGDAESAEKLFKRVTQGSVFSWTAMILCYNQEGRFLQVLDAFVEMQESGIEPDRLILVAVLLSCAQLGCLMRGKSAHGFALRRGMDTNVEVMGSSLIDMYAGCGKVGSCCKVFEAMHDKGIASWNSLIAAHAQNGFAEDALGLFFDTWSSGLHPDSFTLSSSLSACAHVSSSILGCQIHGYIVKSGFFINEFVHNSLINMYCKCGLVEMGQQIFDLVEKKSIISWNTLMCGLAQNGKAIDSLILFDQMLSECSEIDQFPFASAVQACSHLGYLDKGRWIHHKLIMYGLGDDIFVNTALTDMYAKCGELETAKKMFHHINDKNVVSWSAMIGGYGIHGQAHSAVSLFSQMIELGIRPNEVTFLNLLCACSHARNIEQGKFYFNLMTEKFRIKPTQEHYTCMVDLFSRAGQVDCAYKIIKNMALTPDASTWSALLNGCRIYKRTDVIELLKQEVLYEQFGDGHYMQLSNIYAEAERWDCFGEFRSKMKYKGSDKIAGYSTIEINHRLYRFCSGDSSHQQTKEIYSFLEELERLIEKQGQVADRGSPLKNVQSHSERLAIAFGIMRTNPGTKLRIFKNLRVCESCHKFTKLISKLTSREILMRDMNRFHHFKNGSCSCQDYW